jgi:hypothetical protein
MTMAIGDILEMTLFQTFLSQQLLNVFYFELDSKESLVGYDDLAVAFSSVVLGDMQAIQSTSLAYTQLRIKNLTNGIDLHEEPLSDTGAISAGDNDRSFTAAAFRLNRTTTVTRHGQKRVGGLREGTFEGNSIATGWATALGNLASAFATPIERSGTVEHDVVASPVIIGRTLNIGTGRYELDISKVNPVASCQFTHVTTQTTRTAGRGS